MTWTTRPRSKAGPLSTITMGDGPLVVLIHGVGLRAEAWGVQIDVLSEHGRVLAVDMPGHGQSAPFAQTPELDDFTDRIAQLLDAPAIVIGHSFGAMIALDLAIKHADHVKGVAALNAIYRRDVAAKAAVKARADKLDGKTVADPSATLHRWFGAEPSPERNACESWLRAVNPAGYRDAYRVFARENGPPDESLQALCCPALFLTGAREPNSTADMSQRMADLVPAGRAEIVPEAAHMMPMTHAAQVNAILSDFITGAA